MTPPSKHPGPHFASFAIDIPGFTALRTRLYVSEDALSHVLARSRIPRTNRAVICPACFFALLSSLTADATPYAPLCACRNCGDPCGESTVRLAVRSTHQSEFKDLSTSRRPS